MMTNPASPTDIYVIDIESGDKSSVAGVSKEEEGSIKKLSHSLIGNIPSNIFVNPDLVKYKSFDGLEISAYSYKPNHENFAFDNKEARFGAVLSIHGGPTAQERPLYD